MTIVKHSIHLIMLLKSDINKSINFVTDLYKHNIVAKIILWVN